MIYHIEVEDNLEDVKLAELNCQKNALFKANEILSYIKAMAPDMKIDGIKNSLVELVKTSKDWGTLTLVLQSIESSKGSSDKTSEEKENA